MIVGMIKQSFLQQFKRGGGSGQMQNSILEKGEIIIIVMIVLSYLSYLCDIFNLIYLTLPNLHI